MKKTMRTFARIALSALLAVSVIASAGQTFFAAPSTGSDHGIVARGPFTPTTQGVTWESGVTWE